MLFRRIIPILICLLSGTLLFYLVFLILPYFRFLDLFPFLLFAAVIEEVFKIMSSLLLEKFVEERNCLIWVALGFAILENLFYYAYFGYIWRRIPPTLVHLALAVTFIWIRKESNGKAVLVCILLHFSYNFLVL